MVALKNENITVRFLVAWKNIAPHVWKSRWEKICEIFRSILYIIKPTDSFPGTNYGGERLITEDQSI